MTKFVVLGEPLAVELANTIAVTDGGLKDLLLTQDDVEEWIRTEGAGGGVPRLREARRLRDAVRELFAAVLEDREPDPHAIEVANAASRAGPARPALSWPRGGRPQVLDGDHGAAGKAILGAIARSAIEIMGGSDRDRLHRCEGPECVLLFVAEHPRRRWCSPDACGNRVRVARHYQRHRERA